MPRTLKSSLLRYLGHMANDLFWFILPLVLPQLMKKYQLSYGEGGGILTIYLAVSAVGSYVMGKLSDRIPRRLIMGVGFLVSASGLIAAGYATQYWSFMVFIIITGLGMSTFHPTMYAHIEETFGSERGKILGRWEASGTLAVLVMFLVNGALLDQIGIRGVLIFTSIPALIMGIVTINARTMDGLSRDEEKRDTASPASVPIGLFLLFLLSVVLRVASVAAVLNFLPTIFNDFFGLSLDMAVWASGLYFAGGIAGSLWVSRFAHPRSAFLILMIGALMLSPLVFAMSMNTHIILPALITILIGIFGSATFVGQNMVLGPLSARFGKGEAFGILMAVMTLTASVSPTLLGFAIDNLGFAVALKLTAIPVLLSLILLVLLKGKVDKFLK